MLVSGLTPHTHSTLFLIKPRVCIRVAYWTAQFSWYVFVFGLMYVFVFGLLGGFHAPPRLNSWRSTSGIFVTLPVLVLVFVFVCWPELRFSHVIS
jgi:hypothetical protein